MTVMPAFLSSLLQPCAFGPRRDGIIAMMVVTGLYLLFEIAFAARLLDVVSSTLNEKEIHQIEVAGRIISGFALTLVVWSSLILPRARAMGYNPLARVAWLSLSCIACCGFSYFVQEAILSGITRSSSAEERRAATTMSLIAASVQNSDVTLKGIDFDSVGRDSPELKTFVSLLPALALKVPDLDNRTSSEVHGLLERAAKREIGDEIHFFNEIYLPSEVAIKEAWNSYLDGSEKYKEAIGKIGRVQEEKYRAYRNGLGRWRPEQIPRNRWAGVRSDVNWKLDMSLPMGWKPTDRATFNASIRDDITKQARDTFRREIRQSLGEELEPGLSFQAFIQSDAVQRKWRREIGMDVAVPLRPDLSFEQARTQIYNAWVRAIADREFPTYVAPAAAFADGALRSEEGIRAIRMTYIPLIAFCFSILGALVHTFKTAYFAAHACVYERYGFYGRKLKRIKSCLIVCVAGLAILTARQTNPVTESELFLELEKTVAEEMSVLVSMPMRIVLQMQPYVYPIASGARHLLGGITFDFDPETEVPAFELFARAD